MAGRILTCSQNIGILSPRASKVRHEGSAIRQLKMLKLGGNGRHLRSVAVVALVGFGQCLPEVGFRNSFAPGQNSQFRGALGNMDDVVFGPQLASVSEGRWPDGSGTLTRFPTTPSPGGMNYLDTDADGLPDAWEIQHGLDPLDPGDARQDSDGDGFDNRAEFAAGTDPRDPQSRLTLGSVQASSGGVTLRFTAVAGKSYVVEFSATATGPFWSRLSAIKPRPVSGTVTVVDPSAARAGTRFYRLVTP